VCIFYTQNCVPAEQLRYAHILFVFDIPRRCLHACGVYSLLFKNGGKFLRSRAELAGDFCGHVQNWPEIFAVTCTIGRRFLRSRVEKTALHLRRGPEHAGSAGARRQRRSTQAAPEHAGSAGARRQRRSTQAAPEHAGSAGHACPRTCGKDAPGAAHK
jgi:hypothetical protein